jgi:hypothetical protein
MSNLNSHLKCRTFACIFRRILRNPQHSGVIVTTYAGTDRSSLYRIKISCSRCYNISHNCASLSLYCCLCRTIRSKKIPVVPVSYREKIRVGRSEINFFFKYFFHGFGGWAICSRAPTSILTRDT